MIKADDLIFCVIRPALQSIAMAAPKAIALVAGTCAAESLGGDYLIQSSFVPGHDIRAFTGGLGIFQMQHDDHDDIVKNYFPRDPTTAGKMVAAFGSFTAERLVTDLLYAAAFCRIHYLRNDEPLPDYNNVSALASYWKRYYNSSHGAGDDAHFINNYALVAPAVNKLIAMG